MKNRTTKDEQMQKLMIEISENVENRAKARKLRNKLDKLMKEKTFSPLDL